MKAAGQATASRPGRATVPDVVVVGGGPAGLATAIATRLAGRSVRVLDRRTPPIDKACGEGLMPDAVASLDALGVHVPADRRWPFVGIRYVDGDVVADGDFPDRPGLGVRRTVLHQALVARAEALGIDLSWQVRVDEAIPGVAATIDRLETSAGPVRGRWFVAADGLRSPLRQWAGLARPAEARSGQRFGVRRHFASAPWSDRVEVYWADDCEAYVTPVAADEVGVAILWSARKARFDDLLSSFPDLAARLHGAASRSRDRGWGPLRQRVRRPVVGNLALVGDAAGYVDAITGEGLAVAFHQALALGDSLGRGNLARYARSSRRIGRLPDAMTEMVLWCERRPAFRRRLIRVLSVDRRIFQAFLAVHCRAQPAHHLGSVAPRLLWRLLSVG